MLSFEPLKGRCTKDATRHRAGSLDEWAQPRQSFGASLRGFHMRYHRCRLKYLRETPRVLEALRGNKEDWCEGDEGSCGPWNPFIKITSMTKTSSCVGLTWGRAMGCSEEFRFHFIHLRLLSWRPILCVPSCGNDLAAHDLDQLCLSLLDFVYLPLSWIFWSWVGIY